MLPDYMHALIVIFIYVMGFTSGINFALWYKK